MLKNNKHARQIISKSIDFLAKFVQKIRPKSAVLTYCFLAKLAQ